MTKRTICALIAGFIAAFGFTSASTSAKAHGQYERSGMSRYGHMGARHHSTGGWYSNRAHRGFRMQKRIDRFMSRYDTNKDSKITQEEIDTTRTEDLNKFDKDKNGKLSLNEFQDLWVKRNRERIVRRFQRFDKDGDAEVTLEEYKEPKARMVERLDRNGDGALTRNDRRKYRHFGDRRGYRGDMERRRYRGDNDDDGRGPMRPMGPPKDQ